MIKTITEAIDQIAILQRKVKENKENELLQKDMADALKNLEDFIKANAMNQPVLENKQLDITLNTNEIIDFLVLKTIDEKRANEKRLPKMSDLEILKMIGKKIDTKALSDTIAVGQWIPTEFQKNVIDLIISEIAVVADFFQNIFRWETGSNKRDYPYVDWFASFYGVEGTTITSTTAQANKFNLTAYPFKGMFEITDEADMFTVVEMLPILRNALIKGLAFAIEDAIINGDTTISAPSTRRYWNGLRRLAISSTNTASMATFNITNFRALRQKLGQFGIRPNELLIVCEEAVAYYNFLNDANFLTIDKVGAKATVLTGQIGIYDGIPLKTSSALPKTNATGEIDGNPTNNTKGSFLIINKRPFAVGFYGTPIVETDKDITKGITYIVMRQYFGFAPVYTNKGVVYGYNMG